MCAAAIDACENEPASDLGLHISYWHHQRTTDLTGAPVSGWALVGAPCLPLDDPALAEAEGEPSLTQLVLQAWRRVEIEPARVVVQPPGGTLVNLPAIVHTSDATRVFDVSLLGRAVRLRAVPTAYRWSFGDGAVVTTTGPGRPYPATDVAHTYTAGGRFAVSVAVSYRGEYAVDGGPALPLPGATTVAGPVEPLPVREARTRLVED